MPTSADRRRRARGVWLVLMAAALLAGLAGGCLRQAPVPDAASATPAAASGPIAVTADGRQAWVVNPDADSVTRVGLLDLTAAAPIAVGREPWALSLAPDGTVVVANRADGTLSLVRDGAVAAVVEVGPEPVGVVVSTNGDRAYVSLNSAAEIAVVSLTAGAVIARWPTSPQPWALALARDGDGNDTLAVTHRLPVATGDASDPPEGVVTLFTHTGSARELLIAPYAFGHVNALEGIAWHQDTVWLAHLLQNPSGVDRAFNRTVSAAVTALELRKAGGAEQRDLHLNDAGFSTPANGPRALALTRDGATLYVVLAGSDVVMGLDVRRSDAPRLIGFWPTGANPRGIALTPDGTRAVVMNFASRDVSVLDLRDPRDRREIARVTVAPETLSPALALGQRLFHHASDPRMSTLGWISCASCHLDGGSDGTTWFTDDGPRQTPPLWRLAGTEPLHAAATRDEVQDFEHDILLLMRGGGLATGAPPAPLGQSAAGRSHALDALAAFVGLGIRTPAAPPSVDATAVMRGRQVFADAGCQSCHGGPNWTISALPERPSIIGEGMQARIVDVLRDVGTFRSGVDVLGAEGFDVPTLRGIHATAPYLHDGSAATLFQVLDEPRHAPASLTAEQRSDLVAFLLSIDDATPPVSVP